MLPLTLLSPPILGCGQVAKRHIKRYDAVETVLKPLPFFVGLRTGVGLIQILFPGIGRLVNGFG